MKKAFYDKDFKLGVLGGGQLGRMMIPPALDLDVRLHFLDPNPESPCLQFSKNHVIGDFNDKETVLNFGRQMDLITVEIEHVNTEALKELESEGIEVYPQPHILDIVKDKGIQKEWYKANGIPTADFYLASDISEIKNEYPFVQKMRTGGYDGKGVQVIRNADDSGKMFKDASVIEQLVDFETELAVIVSRNKSGNVKAFPVVDMKFDESVNLVSFLFSPADISASIESKAKEIAIDIISKLKMVGNLAVEFFLTKTGELIVNEMAPRPHNSGHHTIEANIVSQYEQHLRAILNLPLGDTDLIKPAVMVNLLGNDGYTGAVKYLGIDEFLNISDVHFHIYGKTDTKPARKMGHVTIVNDDLSAAIQLAEEIKKGVKVIAT